MMHHSNILLFIPISMRTIVFDILDATDAYIPDPRNLALVQEFLDLSA